MTDEPKITTDTSEETATTTEVAETVAETKSKTKPKNTPTDGHWWWGTGRRKSAVARVRIKPGNGAFKVNNRDLPQYFTESRDLKNIMTMLEKTNTKDAIDVVVRTNGVDSPAKLVPLFSV